MVILTNSEDPDVTQNLAAFQLAKNKLISQDEKMQYFFWNYKARFFYQLIYKV